MLRRILYFAAILVPLAATTAFAVCPLNQFTLGTTVIKSALDVDTQNSSGGGARYSIPVGVLQASSHCTGAGCTSSISVYVEDLFTVSGLPAGTPVPLTAHLYLDDATSTSYANIQDTHANVASNPTPVPDDELLLPVAAVAGQPFQLHFEIGCSNVGSAVGRIGGTFSFTGLPVGTGLSSCHGYISGTPSAARETSWGKVKILYR